MIFPKDINRRLAEKRKIAGDNAAQLTITIFILGNLIGFFVVDWLITSFFGAGFWLTIVIMLVLNLTVGVFAFRIFIFDESAKIREYQSSEGDSFAKFMKMRKDVVRELELPTAKINAYEFTNGSMAFTMQLKFGSNDNVKAQSTAMVFQELFRIAHMYNFETRVLIGSENFGRSKEYEAYAESVNRVPSKILRNALVLMTDAVMAEHERKGNASCVYFTVRSMVGYQRADLEDVIKSFLKTLNENLTAFREIRFLNNEEMLDLFVEFYGIGAIDLSTVQAIELSKNLDDSFSRMLSIHSLTDENGDIYKAENPMVDPFKLEESKI